MDKNIKPKISIIMPVYNVEKYIVEAMDSILNQTFKDWELIVIDDGSKDRTREILKDYAEKDSRIILILREKNLGITSNLNDGLQRAKSNLIARMDGDDISAPNRLEVEYEFMKKHPNHVFVGTWAEMIDEEGKHIEYMKYPRESWHLRAKMLKNNYIIHGSVIFRKDIAFKVGGYPHEFKYAEDYVLWMRMMKFGKIGNIPQYLYKWRWHDIDTQSEKLKMQRDVSAFAKKEAWANRLYMKERIILFFINIYTAIRGWILRLFK